VSCTCTLSVVFYKLLLYLLGKNLADMGLDELNEKEDEIDEEEERIFEEYR